MRSASPSTTLSASSASLKARWRSSGSSTRRLRPSANANPASPASSSRSTADDTRRPVSPSASGISSTTSPASTSVGAAIVPGRDRARRRGRPRPAAGGASHPRSGLRAWARTTATLAPADRSVPSSLPRATRSSRSSISRASTARWKLVGGLLGGALGGADALDLGGDQRRHQPQQRPVGVRSRVRIRSWPTGDSATRSSIVVTSSASRISERSSAGERAATASTAGRAVDQDEAGVQRPRGRAQDLRQPGAGLDGIGDRGERPQVRGARSAALRAVGHARLHSAATVAALRRAAATRG